MNSFHMVILVFIKKKIVLGVAIATATATAIGLAFMYYAAHSAGVSSDDFPFVNFLGGIKAYNDSDLPSDNHVIHSDYPVHGEGQLCKLSDSSVYILNDKFNCAGGNFNNCKMSDVSNATSFVINYISKGYVSLQMGVDLYWLKSGKTLICETLQPQSVGYNCRSYNETVKPAFGLALLQHDDTKKLVRFYLRNDIIKYSKYKMSAYVNQECEEMPYTGTGTFVRSTCKLSLSLTSQAKLEIEHGKAGKCTEVVNKDFKSSFLSCESRGEPLLDHVFSESGHYICSLKQGHSEL